MSLSLFLNAPPPPETYTLSLHDALPIFTSAPASRSCFADSSSSPSVVTPARAIRKTVPASGARAIASETARIGVLSSRSEEHTSELQSRENLVCRLLLEKKKKNTV